MDIRFRRTPAVVLGLCAVVYVWLLRGVRYNDFYYDEWDFVDKEYRWHLRDYFVPHVEHWSTVPMVVYKIELKLFGAHHVYFSATLLVLHCAIAFLLFTLIRRTCGDILATAAAALMLVLGSGAEDIVWAFQIGYTSSVAGGLLALLALDTPKLSRRRAALVVAALVVSLSSSGVGLYFLAAAGVRVLLQPQWRRRLVLVAIPALTYGIWYLSFGSEGVSANRSPFSLEALSGAKQYLPTGIGAAAVGMVDPQVVDWDGAAFVAVCVVLGTLAWQRRMAAAPAIVAGAALFTQFLLMSLVRAQMGSEEARISRYRYVATVFLLIIVAELLREVRWRPKAQLILPAVLLICIGYNVREMDFTMQTTRQNTWRLHAQFQTVWLLRDAPGLNQDAVINAFQAPTLHVDEYLRSRKRLGSPLRTVDRAGLVGMDQVAVNGVLDLALPLEISVSSDPGKATSPAAGGGASCVTVPAKSATQLTVHDRSRVDIRPIAPDAAAAAWLADDDAPPEIMAMSNWLDGTNVSRQSAVYPVAQSTSVSVTVPDSGQNLPRVLRIAAPSHTALTVCGG